MPLKSQNADMLQFQISPDWDILKKHNIFINLRMGGTNLLPRDYLFWSSQSKLINKFDLSFMSLPRKPVVTKAKLSGLGPLKWKNAAYKASYHRYEALYTAFFILF